LQAIVPGVWFYSGDFPLNGQCNSVVIERKRDLVVVDANSVSGALAVQSAIKQLSPKPVRYVLLTHHHGDHVFGNAVWTRTGAVTVAHQSMLDELARIEPARWRSAAAHDPRMAALGDSLEPPKQTFAGPVWTLDDDVRPIEVHFFGAAHTRDDVVVYLPGDQVLCSGDVALSTSLNSFFDSDFQHWPAVLQAVRQLGAGHVLPGHGDAGGAEILEGQGRFLAALGDAVADGLARGLAPRQIASALHFPDELKPWVGRALAQQVETICAQLAPSPK
jgi:cyclase